MIIYDILKSNERILKNLISIDVVLPNLELTYIILDVIGSVVFQLFTEQNFQK